MESTLDDVAVVNPEENRLAITGHRLPRAVIQQLRPDAVKAHGSLIIGSLHPFGFAGWPRATRRWNPLSRDAVPLFESIDVVRSDVCSIGRKVRPMEPECPRLACDAKTKSRTQLSRDGVIPEADAADPNMIKMHNLRRAIQNLY